MDLREFKTLLSHEFGPKLRKATPGNVRDFLDRMQGSALGVDLNGRILLEEKAASYEEILKDFFASVLELPKEEAIVALWLVAFDFAFSAIELQDDERFKSLFGETEGFGEG